MIPTTMHMQLVVAVLAVYLAAAHSQWPDEPSRESQDSVKYEPTWESLDKRPNPEWYDDSKFGIFIHWGVFSVPALVSEWFWYTWKTGNKQAQDFMRTNYPPDFTYGDFAKDFHATFFDPVHWAKVFQSSGAKYVVLTSKHHEGYTMWPSKYSFNWNSMDVGPNRDLVGEFATAIKNQTKLKFGLYHSMFEWFHPLYLEDKANGYRTRNFPDAKALPELYEIVKTYEPEVIWSDGEWEASSTYWNSTGFIAWLFNESPVKDTVVTNDRWGNETRCKHGSFLTCEDSFDPGQLLPKKWENCLTVDMYSWGYRRDMVVENLRTAAELIEALTRAVSCGGNLLLNIGPTSDGTIASIFQERLYQMGSWLDVNGEAIYATKPWIHQNDTVNPHVWYTQSKKTGLVYAICLQPARKNITLGAPKFSKLTTVKVLGGPGVLKWTLDEQGNTVVKLPQRDELDDTAMWSVVLVLDNLKNKPREAPPRITMSMLPQVRSMWRDENPHKQTRKA